MKALASPSLSNRVTAVHRPPFSFEDRGLKLNRFCTIANPGIAVGPVHIGYGVKPHAIAALVNLQRSPLCLISRIQSDPTGDCPEYNLKQKKLVMFLAY